MQGRAPEPPDADRLTTLHARRAREGDAESLGWVVERFRPLLLAQARYRMGPRLAARLDPEDVVQDVWAVVLPRLPELSERDGRATPVLVRFLATTLLHHVNNLIRKRALGGGGAAEGEEEDPLLALPAATRGPLTRALRGEQHERVLAAIEALDERDRELVCLRAIEQRPNAETAELLGLAPNTAAQAYARALARLRTRLPGSVFDELAD